MTSSPTNQPPAAGAREPADPRQVADLAAFDFDRTLTRRDTFVPFLRFVAGPRRYGLAVATASIGAVRPPVSRDRVKAELCRAVFRGRHREELADAGARYARMVLASGMRADVLARLRWHQEAGHAVVLVSAGLDTYLDEIAGLLGLDGSLSTGLAFGADDRATGALLGDNCRGPEKARRLAAWWQHTGRPARVWAYGDSAGDAELLAMADRPVRTGRGRLSTAPAPPAGPAGGDR